LAALRSGERREVARALAVEAGYLSVSGRRGSARAIEIANQAHVIAEQPRQLGPRQTAWR
jgi:hypothetical protein